jgi:hypothetical protein
MVAKLPVNGARKDEGAEQEGAMSGSAGLVASSNNAPIDASDAAAACLC